MGAGRTIVRSKEVSREELIKVRVQNSHKMGCKIESKGLPGLEGREENKN